MTATAPTERNTVNPYGVLSFYDYIITGTLSETGYAGGMTGFMYAKGIRIFNPPSFVEPPRERIRKRSQEVSATAGMEIEHVKSCHVCKEELVARMLRVRSNARGLVHLISAIEVLP